MGSDPGKITNCPPCLAERQIRLTPNPRSEVDRSFIDLPAMSIGNGYPSTEKRKPVESQNFSDEQLCDVSPVHAEACGRVLHVSRHTCTPESDAAAPGHEATSNREAVTASALGPPGTNSYCRMCRFEDPQEIAHLARVVLTVGIEIDDEFDIVSPQAHPKPLKNGRAETRTWPTDDVNVNSQPTDIGLDRRDDGIVAAVIHNHDVEVPPELL